MSEKLDIVDGNDEVIDKASREEAHDRGLRHRSVMFFVFNHEDELLMTKRSEEKRFFPGYWSIVLGGHVPSGMSYEEALEKEMEEEIGVSAGYEEMGNFQKNIEEEKENVKLFMVKVEQENIELAPEEFEEGKFIDPEKLFSELDTRDFLPETEKVIEYLDL